MTILEEIGEYLEDNSVGTVSTDLFLGKMTSEPDNQVGVIDTGGLPSQRHTPIKQLTFQIVVRNTDYEDAMTKANTIRDLLHGDDVTGKIDYELTSGGTRVLTSYALQEPYRLGQDESGRYEIVSNYNLVIV